MTCFLPWILLFPSLGEEICRFVHRGPLPPVTPSIGIYLTAFLITLITEALIMSLLWKRISVRLFVAVLCANLLTHPATVYLWLPMATKWGFSARSILLGAELLIPVIESIVYRRFGLGTYVRCLITSVLSNLGSWILVALLQVLGWWF